MSKGEHLPLVFQEAKSDKEIEAIFYHNISAYFDSEEFDWTVPWLKGLKKSGWRLFGVHLEDEIIAAFFVVLEDGMLTSKQTPVKMNHQGQGVSHRIKHQIEIVAKESKVKSIINICAIDNFRMVALNESHGYKKTGNHPENKKTLVEWLKNI